MSEDTTMIPSENISLRPVPKEQWELLSQGAEARVWKLAANGVPGNSEDQTIICKERFSKAYRHPDLDERLTKSRCRGEARALEKCAKKSDIRVPRVFKVEPPVLYMEYVCGTSLKSYLLETESDDRLPYSELAHKMGEVLGKLHNLGLIHGDLTTSNILVLEEGRMFQLVLIDFGLAKSTCSVEEQAVDLYVLERALQSTHPELPENFLDMILESYVAVTSGDSMKATKPHHQSTLNRLEQVRLRGRKRECFG
jgi:TP53 regulating kinase and related kinases